MNRNRIRVLITIAALWQPAFAHDPTQHDFRMVSFDPPPPAPTFTLPNLAGQSIQLTDFRGRYVLLNFWATWCPPCIKEMPSMEKLQQRFEQQNFTVVAVSLDTEEPAVVEEFIQRLALQFTIVLDPQNKSSAEYGASNLPSTFLIDPQGRVIAAAKGERDWFSDRALSYFNELLQ